MLNALPFVNVELLLLTGRALVLLTATLVLIQVFRRWRHSNERDFERMFEQIDLLRSEVLLLQERVNDQPPVVQNAIRVIPTMPRHSTPVTPTPRGYEVAVRLARTGASVDELISSCGVSRHEAELLLRLHGKRHETSASAATTQRRTERVREEA